MIERTYLHLGWPKTGTTSLQATMAAQRALLATGRTVYPDRWSRKADHSHNALTDLPRVAPGGFDDLLGFLAEQKAPSVLLSAESFTGWLLRDGTLEALVGLLGALRETAPLTTIWTLRRIDDMAHSLYVQMSRAGIAPMSPEQFMERVPCEQMFSSMRALADLTGIDCVYLEYDRHGAHNFELLDTLGLPVEVSDALESQLRSSPRLNASDSDELAGPEVRRALRERALQSAQSSGFAPYLNFFDLHDRARA